MSLLKSTPAFETEDGNAAAEVKTVADVKTETVTKEQVPAVQRSTAVSVRLDTKVLDGMKEALRVDYNTLTQIIATNGNFKSREDSKILGDTVVFELLSFQDSFVVSPGDDKAPDDLVRYSDDGVTCSDGTDVKEHLAFLHQGGYTKASLKKRSVVVGAIETAAKSQDFNGSLVQFDLSPQSRIRWDRYRAEVAYGLGKGRFTPEQVVRVKATAELASMGGNDFTLAKFAVAE